MINHFSTKTHIGGPNVEELHLEGILPIQKEELTHLKPGLTLAGNQLIHLTKYTHQMNRLKWQSASTGSTTMVKT
jgi:hypothetical protein